MVLEVSLQKLNTAFVLAVRVMGPSLSPVGGEDRREGWGLPFRAIFMLP